ncbi:hypothetical protein FA15DRAFT_702332 [Coprinopsis marcescibilis]|uniref:DUF6533 domain-containing protein n=1 Tax=Coprinopsis marcescibilis TaxID=230819 RepID=A0A5C3L300_COPMA|nr:hypothetical protein FA15DRAFT_702332 [Coprinopsis marcescibilis]
MRILRVALEDHGSNFGNPQAPPPDGGGQEDYLFAISTVLVVDYLHTLPLEVRYIWPGSWSLIKALFFVARYMAFADITFVLMYCLSTALAPKDCQILLNVASMATLTSVVFSEAILFLRVYAISSRGWGIRIYLSVHYIVIHAAQYVLLAKFLQSLSFRDSPFPDLVGCFSLPAPNSGRYLSFFFGSSVVGQIIIFFIMCWIGLRKYRAHNSNLGAIFFRDGTIYFALLTSIGIANMTVNLTASATFNVMLAECQAIFHAVFATRMVLHLREISSPESESEEHLPYSEKSAESIANESFVHVPPGFELVELKEIRYMHRGYAV